MRQLTSRISPLPQQCRCRSGGLPFTANLVNEFGIFRNAIYYHTSSLHTPYAIKATRVSVSTVTIPVYPAGLRFLRSESLSRSRTDLKVTNRQNTRIIRLQYRGQTASASFLYTNIGDAYTIALCTYAWAPLKTII